MVNEDDVLLVSGGFTMDATQNNLAEQVHMDGTADLVDDCSQLDTLDPRMRSGVISRL